MKKLWKRKLKVRHACMMDAWSILDLFWINFESFLIYFGSNLAPMELWDQDQRGNWRLVVSQVQNLKKTMVFQWFLSRQGVPKPAQMKNGKRRNGLCESVWLSCFSSWASSFTMYRVALHTPRAAFFDELAASGNVNEFDGIAFRIGSTSVAIYSIALHMPHAARCARRARRFSKRSPEILPWGSFLIYFGTNLAPTELWDEDQRGNWRQLLPPAGQVTPRQEKCSSREAPGSAKIDLQICCGVPKVSPRACEIEQKLTKIRIDKPLLNCSRWKVDFDGFQMQKWLI